MNVINTVLQKRIDPYTPLEASSQAPAFKFLKQLSRTEYWFFYRNFVNLKRWNIEDAYKETLLKSLLGRRSSCAPIRCCGSSPFRGTPRTTTRILHKTIRPCLRKNAAHPALGVMLRGDENCNSYGWE